KEREGAPLAGDARQADLAAQEPRDLAADCEAEPRAAVLAGRRAVGLLESLEDDLLLFRRDPDPGVGDRDREHRARRVQRLDRRAPSATGRLDAKGDRALLGELEGVGEEVLDDLLEAGRIREERAGDVGSDLDPEADALGLGDVTEIPLDVVQEL